MATFSNLIRKFPLHMSNNVQILSVPGTAYSDNQRHQAPPKLYFHSTHGSHFLPTGDRKLTPYCSHNVPYTDQLCTIMPVLT